MSRSVFEQLIRQPWLQAIADAIAGGNLDRKRELPAACWQAAFGGKKRSNAHAHPSGLFALDIDHIDSPEALFESFKHRLSELGIYIVHKTPSTRGLRIVALCRPEFSSISDNQAWLAKEIGVEHDAVTRDFARLSFLVPESYFYFYNPQIFSDHAAVLLHNSDLAPSPESSSVHPQSSPQLVHREAVNPPSSSEAFVQGTTIPQTDLLFRGVRYSEIVSELVNRTGGEPYEGERNNRLYLICRLLTNITDRQVDKLFKICPRFGLSDEEVRACCESACKSARTEKLPYVLYKVLGDLGVNSAANANAIAAGAAAADAIATDAIAAAAGSDILSADLNAMPEVAHLPPLIREFVVTAPDDFRAATAMACLPICGFLGSRLRARYLDGEMQAPSFIVNIVAPAASGKGSFLRIADICLEKIRMQDDLGREEEAEYQRQSKLKKNEKKQLEEPQPIVRDIPAKVSVAQLLKRMVNARGLHLISISPEADTLTNSNKSGAWAQKSDIYRVAQDGDGGRYGQDYKSDASFSATCKMRYNLLTLGTPGAIARAYPDTEDGLITRCIIISLPDQFGKTMPLRKELTAEQMQTIRRKTDALMAVCQDKEGNVLPDYPMDLPWLNEGVNKWIEQQRLASVRNEDRARDQFRRRAALIGFRAGMVAAFLWGKITQERQTYTLDFALWVANYVLDSLLDRYSEKVNEQALSYAVPQAKRYPSLFEVMPDLFTLKDLRKACIAQSIKSPLKSIIFRWTENKLIEKQGDTYVKLTK